MAENQVLIPPDKETQPPAANPKPTLGPGDVVALIVGVVIGAGIFRTPSLVAATVGSGDIMLLAWLLGGIISLVGALCYAELTTAFPNTGGDYHFLMRAYGRRVAFLFAWARMSIIQTGSVALLAFIFGDYVSQIFSLGDHSSVIYAALLVILLTGINILGVNMGAAAQKILTTVEVLGLILVVVVGIFFIPATNEISDGLPVASGSGSMGLAMVFVLLTFGGWNEAAYLSSELRSGRKHMVNVLIISIVIITILYLLVNFAYLRGLGIDGMAQSEAVAGDLMENAFGTRGMVLMAVLVAISAMTSANATLFTGARSNYAMGRDFPVFAALGKWDQKTASPVNSFIVQGMVSLALVSLGLFSRNGFETIVEFTSPIFWFFFLLVGISLFILRYKEPGAARPYRVPLYPLIPLIFCITSGYLLYSSIVYTGWGSLVGIGVLLLGVLIQFAMAGTAKATAQKEDNSNSKI